MKRIFRWSAVAGASALLLGVIAIAHRATAQTLTAQGTPQGALNAPADPKPLYVLTFADLTPNNAISGTDLIERYVRDTKKDPGNIRSELLAQSNRTNHFVILQVWQDTAAFNKHEESQRTKDFRTKMQPLLGAPFDQRLHFQVE